MGRRVSRTATLPRGELLSRAWFAIARRRSISRHTSATARIRRLFLGASSGSASINDACHAATLRSELTQSSVVSDVTITSVAIQNLVEREVEESHMRIAVVGTGYVGLVTGTCFADTGHQVSCVDKDRAKIDALLRGEVPIYEPGLEHLIQRNVSEGRLVFTTELAPAVGDAEIVFIAVGTPQSHDGQADLTAVREVARQIGRAVRGFAIIVNKSTVPVGTAKIVTEIIAAETSHPFEVVSNPEFLKEGAAIDDFTKPDRVVVGTSSQRAAEVMRELYAPFLRTGKPLLVMDTASAEMTKYASNALLATRISFMNEIAGLCTAVGADVSQVRSGVGADSRLGYSFLFPGVGYGGDRKSVV